MSLKVFGMKCEELRWSRRSERKREREREKKRERKRNRKIGEGLSFQLKHLWLTT